MNETAWLLVPLHCWQDLYSLPGFVGDPLPPDLLKMGRPVQPYHMPESEELRPCGIQRCEEPHRHGWLVLLPDGTKSNVGRDCGKAVFGIEWSEHVRSHTIARRAHTKAAALARRRDEARIAAAEPIVASGGDFDATRAMQASFYSFPDRVHATLAARAQSSDDELFDFRAPTPFEIGKAKEEKRPIPVKVRYAYGRLRGIGALRLSNHLDGALSRAKGCAAELARLSDAPNSTADQLTEQMRKLQEAKLALMRVPALWYAFFDADNIANLRLLQPCIEKKIRSVRLQPGPEFRVTFVT